MARLNHAIFMKEESQRDNVFTFCTCFGIIGWKRHITTLLATDLDSLLPFKWNWNRVTPE